MVSAGQCMSHAVLCLLPCPSSLRIVTLVLPCIPLCWSESLLMFGVMQPLVLERVPDPEKGAPNGPLSWVHTKALYRLNADSRAVIRGCTDEMCSTPIDPMLFTDHDDTPY